MGHGPVATHQAVFANMPNMVPFVKVLNAFSKEFAYLEYANQLVNTLQKGPLNDKIPARICATAAHGTGDGDDRNPHLQRQRASVPNDVVNDLMIGAHQNSNGAKTGSKGSSDDDVVPADSARVDFELTMNQERSTHAQGQAAVGATLEDDDSGSPLFTPSPGYESGGPSV